MLQVQDWRNSCKTNKKWNMAVYQIPGLLIDHDEHQTIRNCIVKLLIYLIMGTTISRGRNGIVNRTSRELSGYWDESSYYFDITTNTHNWLVSENVENGRRSITNDGNHNTIGTIISTNIWIYSRYIVHSSKTEKRKRDTVDLITL